MFFFVAKSIPYSCPKINLNLRIKTEPITVGADETVYVWFLIHVLKAVHPLQP